MVNIHNGDGEDFGNDDDDDVGNNDEDVCYKVMEENSYYWNLIVIMRIFYESMGSVIVTVVLVTKAMVGKGVIDNVG